MMVIDLSGQRQQLNGAVLDAASELLPRGYHEDMIFLCVGNLCIQLLGDPEDDPLADALTGGPLPICTDEKLTEWINNPSLLELELYVDLRESWQGFNNEEHEAAKAIVTTMARYFSEARP